MHTVFDWVTVAAFAGLIVLFLQRSTGPEENRDSPKHYVLPVLSCAVANYFGNEGQSLIAVAILGAGLAYAIYYLFYLHSKRS